MEKVSRIWLIGYVLEARPASKGMEDADAEARSMERARQSREPCAGSIPLRDERAIDEEGDPHAWLSRASAWFLTQSDT